MRCIVTIFLSLEWLQNKMQNSPPPPQPVLGCNILFLSKFLRSWSIFKEHLNEYLRKLEILIHIFDILINIRPYNVRDFVNNFSLLTQIIDISIKLWYTLNKLFKSSTNIFESLTKIFDILTKMFDILTILEIYYKIFDIIWTEIFRFWQKCIFWLKSSRF